MKTEPVAARGVRRRVRRSGPAQKRCSPLSAAFLSFSVPAPGCRCAYTVGGCAAVILSPGAGRPRQNGGRGEAAKRGRRAIAASAALGGAVCAGFCRWMPADCCGGWGMARRFQRNARGGLASKSGGAATKKEKATVLGRSCPASPAETALYGVWRPGAWCGLMRGCSAVISSPGAGL